MDPLDIATAIAFALAGLLVGWAYFSLMRYSLAYLGSKKTGMRQFVALAFLRVLLFVGGLFGAILVGAWSLIAYVLGFIVARTIAVGRARTACNSSPPASESREHNG